MNFDEWWHKQMPNLVSGEEADDRAIAEAAWVAATKVEREACAVAAEALDRTGREWVRESLWANIKRDTAAAIRARPLPANA